MNKETKNQKNICGYLKNTKILCSTVIIWSILLLINVQILPLKSKINSNYSLSITLLIIAIAAIIILYYLFLKDNIKYFPYLVLYLNYILLFTPNPFENKVFYYIYLGIVLVLDLVASASISVEFIMNRNFTLKKLFTSVITEETIEFTDVTGKKITKKTIEKRQYFFWTLLGVLIPALLSIFK